MQPTQINHTLEKSSWDALPKEFVRKGVLRSGFRGDNSLLVMNWLEPGMEVRPHSHPFDQVVYIVKGRMRLTVGEEAIEIGEGEVLRIPANVLHSGEPLGDQMVMNLDVFSPAREDYLHLTAHQESFASADTHAYAGGRGES